MKTEKLIDWLNSVPTWYVSDGKILNEDIERLKEYDILREIELEYYLKQDWHKGRIVSWSKERRLEASNRIKNYRWINNNFEDKFVNKEKLNEYLDRGWKLGRLKKVA